MLKTRFKSFAWSKRSSIQDSQPEINDLVLNVNNLVDKANILSGGLNDLSQTNTADKNSGLNSVMTTS